MKWYDLYTSDDRNHDSKEYKFIKKVRINSTYIHILKSMIDYMCNLQSRGRVGFACKGFEYSGIEYKIKEDNMNFQFVGSGGDLIHPYDVLAYLYVQKDMDPYMNQQSSTYNVFLRVYGCDGEGEFDFDLRHGLGVIECSEQS